MICAGRRRVWSLDARSRCSRTPTARPSAHDRRRRRTSPRASAPRRRCATRPASSSCSTRPAAALASQLDLQALVQAVTDAARSSAARSSARSSTTSTDAQRRRRSCSTRSRARRARRSRSSGSRAPRRSSARRSAARRRSAATTSRRTRATGRWRRTTACPQGHLPVRSYLAVPVISRSGEVIGGLFFGHPKPGVFTERAERLIVGVAAQAAVAIDNARLYEAAQKRGRGAQARCSRASARRAREAERMSDDEGRVPGDALARAAHAAQRDPRLVAGAAARRRRTEADLQQGLETIERNARVQTQLIEDLLDMSRITSGKLRLDVQPVEPVVVHRGGDRDRAPGGRGEGHPPREAARSRRPGPSPATRAGCSRWSGTCSRTRSSSRPRTARCRSCSSA